MPAHYARGERAGRNAVARLIYASAGSERTGAGNGLPVARVSRRVKRLAHRFQAVGNREGKQMAAALAGAANAIRERRPGQHYGDGTVEYEASGRTGQPEQCTACIFNHLLSSLFDLAETWRLDRKAKYGAR